MSNRYSRGLREAEKAAAERDASTKAHPLAALLLDTLHAALQVELVESKRRAIESQIIGASTVLHSQHPDYTEQECRTALDRAGLTLVPVPVALPEKLETPHGTLYLVECITHGEYRYLSAAQPSGPASTHLVVVDGREVARIAAKNDWHAANKARKLFGSAAAACQIVPPQKIDPFARMR